MSSCRATNAKANGRLMTAAPDMLDALTDLLQALQGMEPLTPQLKASITAAQAAIVKATEVK